MTRHCRKMLLLDRAGLTLIELLLVLTVTAILLSIGPPALRRFVLDAHMIGQVNDFVRAVHLARQVSQLRVTDVVLCAGAANLQCEPRRDWSTGWFMFINTDRDHPPQRDAEEMVLLVQQAWQGGRIAANRQAFAFRPFSIRDTNGTVGFCDERGPAAARAVVISPSGRPRLVFGRSPQIDLTCTF